MRGEHVRETIEFVRVFSVNYETLVMAVFKGHGVVTPSAIITVHSNVGFIPSRSIKMLLPSILR